MFQLLQPIWLFALAGLSVPVIIHLWNQRPGKTLPVGSIALVTANIRADKKNIRLTEWLLLLLRCLLLACIAIALAGPWWRSPATPAAKGWLLMDRHELAVTYKRFKPQVDSLLGTGIEFHYFEEGFPKGNVDQALQLPGDSAGKSLASYRDLIALLNEQPQAQLPLYVFTSNYLRHFRGRRPQTSLNLHWFTYTPEPPAEAVRVPDTTVLHICIYSGTVVQDGRYLKAALDALSVFRKKRLLTSLVTNIPDIPSSADWLFWLDGRPPIDTKNAHHVVFYAKGEVLKRSSYILPAAGSETFAALDLYQSVIAKDSTLPAPVVYWQDGFGQPLLTARQQTGTISYCLYTHIDPSWNELPWSDNFPVILYKLLFPPAASEMLAAANDTTTIDSLQAMPIVLKEPALPSAPVIFKETKLAGFCWMLAFLLFFTERCFSFYHRKAHTDG